MSGQRLRRAARRTVKYKEFYQRSYRSLADTHTQIESYFRFYNERRPLTAYGCSAPGKAYHATEPEAVNQ